MPPLLYISAISKSHKNSEITSITKYYFYTLKVQRFKGVSLNTFIRLKFGVVGLNTLKHSTVRRLCFYERRAHHFRGCALAF